MYIFLIGLLRTIVNITNKYSVTGSTYLRVLFSILHALIINNNL